MRVCVCNCGSHPRLSFIFRLSLFHLAFTSHRRPSPHRSRYDLGLDNYQSFDTTYPYYASHKPVIGRTYILLGVALFHFSNFLLQIPHILSRSFSSMFLDAGVPILPRFFGEELDLGIRSLFFDEDFRQLDSFYSSTRGHSTNSSTSGLSRILWRYRSNASEKNDREKIFQITRRASYYSVLLSVPR